MVERDAIEAKQGPIEAQAEVPKYVSSVVAVGRSARPGEYVVAHFRTGTFLRTDWLGARVVRSLIRGRSNLEALAMVEKIEPGSGELAKRLMFALHIKGAITSEPVGRNRRRRLRVASAMMTVPLTAMGPVVRATPISVLAWLVGVLPSARIARRVSGASRATLSDKLQASGYAGRELAAAMRPTRSLNHLFMFLSTNLPPDRLNRFVDRLFDRESVDRFVRSLEVTGGTVGAFIHGPLCAAVPNAVRVRGQRIVRVIVPWTHGMFVSSASGPMRDFFGDSPEMVVAEQTDRKLTPGPLLRHLKAGRNVYLALDAIAHVRDSVTGELRKPRPDAEIDLLGHRIPRNDGPAWLAVLSGRPLALWSTYYSSNGVVLVSSPPLYPDLSLRTEERVEALSLRLYACAEAAIREHPEAWRYWSLLDLITVDSGELTPAGTVAV